MRDGAHRKGFFAYLSRSELGAGLPAKVPKVLTVTSVSAGVGLGADMK
jgi:hypothetical protein